MVQRRVYHVHCAFGIRGEFIIEYVGEVLNHLEFQRRARSYDKNQHYYFMALNADEIVDATYKGNISRFTNHSCDPVAETQKVRASPTTAEGTPDRAQQETIAVRSSCTCIYLDICGS